MTFSKNNFLCRSLLLVLFLFFLSGYSQAAEVSHRDQIILKEMDCVSDHMFKGGGIVWGDVCAVGTENDFVAKRREREATKSLDAFSSEDAEMRDARTAVASKREVAYEDEPIPLDETIDIPDPGEKPEGDLSDWGEFEMGSEISSIVYREPDLMSMEGEMYGTFVNYRKRFSENPPLEKISDLFKNGDKINAFMADLKYSTGLLDYQSYGTGTSSDHRDHMVEVRGAFGYDVNLKSGSRVTPYWGLGYRYLYDDLRGTSSTGHWGYRREANYYYMPMGFEVRKEFSQGWAVEAVGEYDVFLWGTQKSHFEDGNPQYNTVKNHQDSGYGLRGSVKIMKETKWAEFFVEPFVRYWNIDDSHTASVTFSTIPVGTGREPKNNSTEWGIKFGARF